MHLMGGHHDNQNRVYSELIMLKYPCNGESKSGIITIDFRLNSHGFEPELSSIEYSDIDIRTYVEKNPSVLDKINNLRN
jgi:hypothetical protein